jgi:hypothetical protein
MALLTDRVSRGSAGTTAEAAAAFGGAAAGAAERQPGDYSAGVPGVNEIEAKKTGKSVQKPLDSQAFEGWGIRGSQRR